MQEFAESLVEESCIVDRPASKNLDLYRGVYDASRAAALSGVPESTLHYWARHGIYIPSISPEPRTRYWSWIDLLTLRMIHYLRRDDTPAKAVAMSKIREALKELETINIPRQRSHQVVIARAGTDFYLKVGGTVIRAASGGQTTIPNTVDLLGTYGSGPDLLKPRPQIRIVPGKLHGEPHLLNTRISSATIYALYRDGFLLDDIREMYPEAPGEALDQAIDLEKSMAPRAA